MGVLSEQGQYFPERFNIMSYHYMFNFNNFYYICHITIQGHNNFLVYLYEMMINKLNNNPGIKSVLPIMK